MYIFCISFGKYGCLIVSGKISSYTTVCKSQIQIFTQKYLHLPLFSFSIHLLVQPAHLNSYAIIIFIIMSLFTLRGTPWMKCLLLKIWNHALHVAMHGGLCSQHVVGKTPRLNQTQSAIIFAKTTCHYWSFYSPGSQHSIAKIATLCS